MVFYVLSMQCKAMRLVDHSNLIPALLTLLGQFEKSLPTLKNRFYCVRTALGHLGKVGTPYYLYIPSYAQDI